MLISIIVPVYNVETFLEKCVNSLLCQTYHNLEIILVNDGSTDSSGKLCDELKERDSRIKVIHKENGGLSSARNAGIAIAQGAYIGFVDSDDYVEPDMYETMLSAILEHKKDIACCGREVDLFGLRKKHEFTLDHVKVYDREKAIEELLYLQEMDVSACDKLYTRHIFDEIRYPEGRISEDAAVIFDILQKADGVVHVGKPFYHYIFRKNSISKSKYNERKFDIYTNMNTAIQFVDQNYPRLKNACKVYVCTSVSSIIQLMREDKDAQNAFRDQYKQFMRIFNYGFVETMLSRRVSLKSKTRIGLLKLHMHTVYSRLQETRNKLHYNSRNM